MVACVKIIPVSAFLILLIATAARAGAAEAPADLQPSVALLRERIAKAISKGQEVSAIVRFSGELTKAKLIDVKGEQVKVRIFKFNDLETMLPWNSVDQVSTASAALPTLARDDVDGLLAVLAIFRATGNGDAEDVYGRLTQVGATSGGSGTVDTIKDGEAADPGAAASDVLKRAKEIWERYTPKAAAQTATGAGPGTEGGGGTETGTGGTNKPFTLKVDAGGLPSVPGGRTFYAGPQGRAGNNGSQGAPWDLWSAMDGRQKAIKAGDTVIILGGNYGKGGLYILDLPGTAERPIIFRNDPGAHVAINGALYIPLRCTNSQFVWFMGCEVLTTPPLPATVLTGNELTAHDQGGLQLHGGHDCKFINMAIHNCLKPVWPMDEAVNMEIYGCLVYDNGFLGPDRGHCHCAYVHNKDGVKVISNCIMSTRFPGQWSIHCWAETDIRFVEGVTIEQNIVNGMGPAIICHTVHPLKRIRVLGNMLYNANFSIGHTSQPNEDLELRDNVIGGGKFQIAPFKQLIQSGNETGKVSNKTFLLPNKYDASRANLAIFNGSKASSVTVDASKFMKPGDKYRLMNPKDFYGKPVYEGDCRGGTIQVPMSTEFAAFVVLRGK
jgi:hypothetical protein